MESNTFQSSAHAVIVPFVKLQCEQTADRQRKLNLLRTAEAGSDQLFKSITIESTSTPSECLRAVILANALSIIESLEQPHGIPVIITGAGFLPELFTQLFEAGGYFPYRWTDEMTLADLAARVFQVRKRFNSPLLYFDATNRADVVNLIISSCERADTITLLGAGSLNVSIFTYRHLHLTGVRVFGFDSSILGNLSDENIWRKRFNRAMNVLKQNPLMTGLQITDE